MAITNHERVGKAMELLREGLAPFVERELKTEYGEQTWFEETKRTLTQHQLKFVEKKGKPEWDVAMLLTVLWNNWEKVFRKTLGRAERSFVSELSDTRNKWAHQQPFSTDDAYQKLPELVASVLQSIRQRVEGSVATTASHMSSNIEPT